MLEKLKSRKLWAAIVGVVIGLASIISNEYSLDPSIIEQVSGYVVAAASIVTYILTEGKIDKAGAKRQLIVVHPEEKNE